jgi:hypothetical protein
MRFTPAQIEKIRQVAMEVFMTGDNDEKLYDKATAEIMFPKGTEVDKMLYFLEDCPNLTERLGFLVSN